VWRSLVAHLLWEQGAGGSNPLTPTTTAEPPTFHGKVVFITGASSGIGAALAIEFARQGADVALAARRHDRLEALAENVRRLGRRAVAISCDVRIDGDLEHATGEAITALGAIDVVVANAGFGVAGELRRLALPDYRRQFETNVFGVLRTVYASLTELEKTRGTLVIIGSVAGHVAAPGGTPYAMSKFAVRALAEGLGHEMASRGVGVVLVSPGFVESELRQIDNEGKFRPEAHDRVPAWLVMSSASAARKIVRAVARRRREVVITGHGKVFVFVQRHAPWLVAKLIRTLGIRGRAEPKR
jgi:short-subunit dehydrogenase